MDNINLLYAYIELGLTVRQLKIILAYRGSSKRLYVAHVLKLQESTIKRQITLILKASGLSSMKSFIGYFRPVLDELTKRKAKNEKII